MFANLEYDEKHELGCHETVAVKSLGQSAWSPHTQPSHQLCDLSHTHRNLTAMVAQLELVHF